MRKSPRLSSSQTSHKYLHPRPGLIEQLESRLLLADAHITPSDPANAIQTAINQLQAGDTLYIAPGNYYPAVANAPHNHLLVNNKNGRPSAWITIRNEPNQAKPRLHLGGPTAQQGITINFSSYGNYETSQSDYANGAITNGNGIAMRPIFLTI